MHARWLNLHPQAESPRRPRHLAVTVSIIVALGVGTCISVLGLLHQLLVGSRPYANPEQLVVIENHGSYTLEGRAWESPRLSWPDFRDLESQQQRFAGLGAVAWPGRTTLDTGTRVRSAERLSVTADLLSVLRARAYRGRLLTAADFAPDAPSVALITVQLWHNHFGADPGVINRVVRLGSQPVSVVGIIQDDVVRFLEPRRTLFEDSEYNGAIVVPATGGGGTRAAARYARQLANRGLPQVLAIGRLRPGSTIGQTQTLVRALGRQLAQDHPETNGQRTLEAAAWDEWHTGTLGPVRWLLWTVAMLALVVACASALGLIVADAIRREPEMAVRQALGASNGRLTRLVLTRSLSWTLPGGLIGLGLAWACLRWLTAAPGGSGGLSTPPFGAEMVGLAVGLTIVSGLLLGSVGVRVLRHQKLGTALRESGPTVSAGRGRRLALATIVGIQMAAAMSLGLVSGLLLRSMANLVGTDVGFEVSETFLVRVLLPEDRYPDEAKRATYFNDALTRVRMLPGVGSAAVSDTAPLGGVVALIGGLSAEAPGQPPVSLGPQLSQRVSSGYFESASIPIVRGRAFTEEEYRSRASVVVVDEAFCRKWLAAVDPLQSAIRVGDKAFPIVGIAKDVRSDGPLDSVRATVYLLRSERVGSASIGHFVVRPSARTAQVMDRVVRELVSIDPRVVVDEPTTFRTLFAKRIDNQTRTLRLVTLASVIILLLTGFSISGALGEFVAHKQREIAVRKALGATGLNTMWLVGRYLSVPVIGGVCCGALGGWALARTLSKQLVGVEAADPTTMVATVAVQLVIGAVAAFGSIRRALAVDPATTLRGL